MLATRGLGRSGSAPGYMPTFGLGSLLAFEGLGSIRIVRIAVSADYMNVRLDALEAI